MDNIDTTPRVISIANKLVGGNHPTFFIAEAGINHQGDPLIAKRLIDLAVECKADCVKFQKRNVSRILTKEGLDKPYDNPNSFGATYGEHKLALELSYDTFRMLKEYCDEKDIIFTASGWDEESVDFLDSLGVPFFKMASADLTNFPLLEHTAKKGKPMVISTGMSDMDTVRCAVALVKEFNDQIVLLHCTSTYPAQHDDLNLNVIRTYIQEFPDCVIGYSGHENGIQVTLCAVVMGARVIERHFTLDRTMKGGDHAASLEKPGLERLVRDIHIFEKARGSYEKKFLPNEKPVFLKLAKSVVSAVPIQSGTIITKDMITTKGPGTGISPMKFKQVIGKKALKDIPNDVVLYDSDIDWTEERTTNESTN
jgi:sialic acid synthase